MPAKSKTWVSGFVLVMNACYKPREVAGVAGHNGAGKTVQLKSEGIGIFLISHELHDVFDLSDRVSVIKNGKLIGTRRT